MEKNHRKIQRKILFPSNYKTKWWKCKLEKGHDLYRWGENSHLQNYRSLKYWSELKFHIHFNFPHTQELREHNCSYSGPSFLWFSTVTYWAHLCYFSIFLIVIVLHFSDFTCPPASPSYPVMGIFVSIPLKFSIKVFYTVSKSPDKCVFPCFPEALSIPWWEIIAEL